MVFVTILTEDGIAFFCRDNRGALLCRIASNHHEVKGKDYDSESEEKEGGIRAYRNEVNNKMLISGEFFGRATFNESANEWKCNNCDRAA